MVKKLIEHNVGEYHSAKSVASQSISGHESMLKGSEHVEPSYSITSTSEKSHYCVLEQKTNMPGSCRLQVSKSLVNTRNTGEKSAIKSGTARLANKIPTGQRNSSMAGSPQKVKKLPVTNTAIKVDLTGGGLLTICKECNQPLSSSYHAVLKNCDLCPFSTICSSLLCGHLKYKHGLNLKLPKELNSGNCFLMEYSLSEWMICGCQEFWTKCCNKMVLHLSGCRKGSTTCRFISKSTDGSEQRDTVLGFGEDEIKNPDQNNAVKLECFEGADNEESQTILTEIKDMLTADFIKTEPVPCVLYNNLVYRENEEKVPDQSNQEFCHEMKGEIIEWSVGETVCGKVPMNQWSAGDYVCSKMPGCPWRLCVVCVEPDSGMYTLMKGETRMYHVKFSHDTNETAWLNGNSMVNFSSHFETSLPGNGAKIQTELSHMMNDPQTRAFNLISGKQYDIMPECQQESGVDISDWQQLDTVFEMQQKWLHTDNQESVSKNQPVRQMSDKQQQQLVSKSKTNELIENGFQTKELPIAGCGICGEQFESCLFLALHVRCFHSQIAKTEHVMHCFACDRFITHQRYMKTHQENSHTGKPLIYANFEVYHSTIKMTKICILNGKKMNTAKELSHFEMMYDKAIKVLDLCGFTPEIENLKTIIDGYRFQQEQSYIEIGIIQLLDMGDNQLSDKGDNQLSDKGDNQLTDMSDRKLETKKTAGSMEKSKLSGVICKLNTDDKPPLEDNGYNSKIINSSNRTDEISDSIICNLCGKQFTGEKKNGSIEAHFYEHLHPEVNSISKQEGLVKIFLEEKIESCHFCHRNFKTPVPMQKHLRWYHTCIKCRICEKVMLKKNMYAHIKIHKDNRKVQCDKCGRLFKNARGLKSHKNGTCFLVTCEICGLVMGKRSYKCHIQNHENKRAFQCLECGKCFNTSNNRIIHIRFVHKKIGHNLVVCHGCGKQVKQYHLTGHLKKHCSAYTNTESHRKFECDVCKKQFTQKNTLEKHFKQFHFIERNSDHIPDTTKKGRTYRRNRKRPCVCFVCGKVIPYKMNISRHMETHNEPNPAFHCNICNKDFKGKIRLQIHTSSCHSKEKCVCGYCGKTYKLRVILKRHVQTKHLKQKNVQCTLCQYKCYDSYMLKSHMKFRHKTVPK